MENTWKEAIASAKAGGTVSNVNYLSGADNVLIPRVEWGCGMSGINITNGLCPGGAVRMERLADLALMGRQDPELLVTHKFEGLEKIEDAKYNVGDKVYVRYLGTDKRGKTRLSMVGINQKTGKEA